MTTAEHQPRGHSSDADGAVLALRLAAPRQSWGINSKFDRRETNRFPTKSAIVGLLANALGRDRQDPINDLAALTLGVRIEVPGRLTTDFHTISDYRGLALPATERNPKGVQKRNAKKFTHISVRDYIDDATFVAALRGPSALIDELGAAVRRPARVLYLGRRACQPTGQLHLGVHPATGVDSFLADLPWQASDWMQQLHCQTYGPCTSVVLETIIDDPHGVDELNDVPLSFAVGAHRHTVRKVSYTLVTVATSVDAGNIPEQNTDASAAPDRHDPFDLLG